jgi:NADPH2:quinone reductase
VATPRTGRRAEGGPEVLDVVELPDPVPAEHQQLFEVSSAGVNFAATHQSVL